MSRQQSAGDADYGRIAEGYSHYRRPDPRIADHIETALGDARSVLNVGAGSGSYEPSDREVVAVEPSAAMRALRRPDAPVAVDGIAEALPFPDRAFDAVMTTFSVHQWRDLEQGLRELRRVSRGPVVVLTCDPALLDRFWLNAYAPEVITTEARRYPEPQRIAALLGAGTAIHPVPIPLDCTDGFGEAYYGRPEALLDSGARRADSAWSFVSDDVVDRFERDLRRDLADGTWDLRYGDLRTRPFFDGSLVLISAS